MFSWNFDLLVTKIVINSVSIRVRNYWDHKKCKINFIDIRLRILGLMSHVTIIIRMTIYNSGKKLMAKLMAKQNLRESCIS